MPAAVILSKAKNLINSATYTFEILQLTPQNDVVGKPLDPHLVRHITGFPLPQEANLQLSSEGIF